MDLKADDPEIDLSRFGADPASAELVKESVRLADGSFITVMVPPQHKWRHIGSTGEFEIYRCSYCRKEVRIDVYGKRTGDVNGRCPRDV